MLGFTGRQLIAVIAAAVLGVAAAVAALAGAIEVAIAAAVLLLVQAVVLLVDIRRRLGEVNNRLRVIARRQQSEAKRLAGIERLPQQLAADLTTVVDRTRTVVDASLHGALTSIDTMVGQFNAALGVERLGAVERHVALTSELEAIGGSLERIETTTKASGDDLTTRIGEVDSRERGRHRETKALLRALEYEPVRQVQAVLQLLTRVEARAPLPPTGGWALQPSTILRLAHLVESTKPGLVVECGSGTSTVWLSYLLQAQGLGRVVALEHDEIYAVRSRAMLEEHGLADIAEVRFAPLTDIELDDKTYSWYDSAAVADLEKIDLLLVDGPPEASGPQARYPALPVLKSRLAAQASVVLDDAERPDETEAARRWLADTPELQRVGDPTDRAASFVFRPA